MTCKYCGNEIRDDAKFCPHCGAVSGEASGAEPAQGTAENIPAPRGGGPGRERKKTGLIIGGAAAAAAVIVLLIAAASGLFSNPRKQLGQALDKTFAAYAQSGEAMGLPDLNSLVREGAYSQRFSLELNGLNSNLVGYDVSALEGLGLNMSGSLNQKDRKLDFGLSVFWGEEDIVGLAVQADDSELYFNAPDFTGETFYGVNTETLGDDLRAMAEDPEDVEDISFNLFELLEPFLDRDWSGEMKQEFQAAKAELWASVTVKKEGSSTQNINGTDTKTTLYRVAIPQQALERYVDAMADAMPAGNILEAYLEMLEALGVDQKEIDSLMEDLEGFDPYGEMAEGIKTLLDELGDIELKVGVSDGCVASAAYEGSVQGSEVKAVLYLGGGEEYVDDLSLELEIDGTKITCKSTGNHSGKNGEFSDKTTIRAGLNQITSKFSYQPGNGELSWEIGIPGSVSLDMEGRLTSGKNSMTLDMENIALKAVGMELFSLGMHYYTGPYEAPVQPASTRLITEMTEEELDALSLQIQSNAQEWLEQTQRMFLERLPAELIPALLD